VLLAMGVIGLLFGYKLIRIFVYLVGFVIGFLILSSLTSSANASWAPLMMGIVGGSVLGLICYLFWYLGIFVLGAVVGATLVMVLGCNIPIVVGIAAIISGILAIAIRKFMIIVSTSWNGACALVVASSPLTMNWNAGVLFLVLIALFGGGVWYQYKTSRSNSHE